MSRAVLRCAAYTRKSSEEGLEQAFNSLDAQREAAIDYINSQKHQGWRMIEQHYDDGGYSGGTMKRPAFQKLTEAIKHGEVDVVVVYKVDRLSRSLHDFARMMQLFDEHDVSFVSVTQQFNTTTSMGRLTLNMLLSFAQFEREVTGERIRDKLAATKKKGLWVGGQPPLGYQLKDRQLHIILKEAGLIRNILQGYLDKPSLVELAEQLNKQGFTTKRWSSVKGNGHGGRKLTPKYVYRVLTNPLYIGKIVHKDKTWPGQHKPIINKPLWDRVQKTINKQERRTRHRWDHPHLLKGKLRTRDGFSMSPSVVHRPTSGGGGASGGKRLVRYYVSQKAMREGYKNCVIKTINANHLDDLVRALVLDHLDVESFGHLRHREPQIRDRWIREMIGRVVLATDQLTIELNSGQIEACKDFDWYDIDEEQKTTSGACLYKPTVKRRRKQVILTLAIAIKRLDGKRMLLSPDGQDLFMPTDPQPKDHIVRAIGNAYSWHQTLMQSGVTIKDLAKNCNVSRNLIHKYIKLTHLGPDIIKRALTGTLPPSLTLANLLDAAEHWDWKSQRVYLNLEKSSKKRLFENRRDTAENSERDVCRFGAK